MYPDLASRFIFTYSDLYRLYLSILAFGGAQIPNQPDAVESRLHTGRKPFTRGGTSGKHRIKVFQHRTSSGRLAVHHHHHRTRGNLREVREEEEEEKEGSMSGGSGLEEELREGEQEEQQEEEEGEISVHMRMFPEPTGDDW